MPNTNDVLSNTVNLSLWLSIFFIAISLCGIIAIYLIIKNKSIENESIDKIIDLGKWFVVSVGITLTASIVNDGFREREQDVKELQVFDKYLSNVLEAKGIETIKLLSEYFATVSPDGSIKKSWVNYDLKVDKHILELRDIEKKNAQLETKQEEGSVLTAEETVAKANYQEKLIAAKNISIKSSITQVTEEWVIIAGSDKDIPSANNEVKKVKELNYPVSIYKKGNGYRTVAGPFLDYSEVLIALPEINKKLKTNPYSVNLKTWCMNPEIKDGYIECKQ